MLKLPNRLCLLHICEGKRIFSAHLDLTDPPLAAVLAIAPAQALDIAWAFCSAVSPATCSRKFAIWGRNLLSDWGIFSVVEDEMERQQGARKAVLGLPGVGGQVAGVWGE